MSNNYGSSGSLHETKDGFKHTKLHASNCHKMKTDWIHALYRAYKAVKHPEIIFMFIWGGSFKVSMSELHILYWRIVTDK